MTKNQPEHLELFSSAYPQDLEPIAELLATHDIECHVEAEGTDYNPNFAFNRQNDAVRLMVAYDDFPNAREILIQAGFLADVDPQQALRDWLQELDDNELLDMVADPRGVPADQLQIAQELLQARGLDKEKANVRKEELAAEERKPRSLSWWGRAVLILLAPFIPAASVAAGVIIGFWSSRDATGKRYWIYSTFDRWFFGIYGLFATAIWLYLTLSLNWLR